MLIILKRGTIEECHYCIMTLFHNDNIEAWHYCSMVLLLYGISTVWYYWGGGGCYHHCNCKSENLASEPPKPNSRGYSKEFGFFRIFSDEKKPLPGQNHILDLQW